MSVSAPVPDHSTLSRRISKLEISLPVVKRNQPIHLVVDSTGVKVYGEGEWKVRQHGVGKRRTWRKLHVGVDESTGEIMSAVITTNDVSDDEVFEDLLSNVEAEIEQVSGDGAYDKRKCYDAANQRDAKPTIPPRKNAVIWQHGNCKADPHPRDENLRGIRKVGRKKWKKQSGYHRRSISENTMFRLKTILGGTLRRRNFDSQAVELSIQCALLNRMIQCGKPQSYRVEI